MEPFGNIWRRFECDLRTFGEWQSKAAEGVELRRLCVGLQLATLAPVLRVGRRAKTRPSGALTSVAHSICRQFAAPLRPTTVAGEPKVGGGGGDALGELAIVWPVLCEPFCGREESIGVERASLALRAEHKVACANDPAWLISESEGHARQAGAPLARCRLGALQTRCTAYEVHCRQAPQTRSRTAVCRGAALHWMDCLCFACRQSA